MFKAVERISRRRLALATVVTLLQGTAALSAEPAASAAEPAASGQSSPPAATLSERVPYLDGPGQAKFEEYLSRPLPRAFAISESGAFGIGSGAVPSGPMPAPPGPSSIAPPPSNVPNAPP